jgi:iron complex outermembrane receptor protein
MFAIDKRDLSRCIATCLVAGNAVSVATVQAQQEGLEEVIVTAQKREERLQEVPISVTVLSADQIAALKLNSGTDVARHTPNLRASVAGNEDQPKFSIRGLSQFDFNLNASSPTGVFYDEVYVASQFLGGPQIFDLARVEVLRGPQGTLFGKNTTAGALDFITRTPNLDGSADASVTAEAGENNYYRVQGGFDIPMIEDTLGARVAFNASKSDGWVENINPSPSATDLSSIDNHALRFTLAYRNENFDATARFWSTRSSPSAIGIISTGLCPSLRPNGTPRCIIPMPPGTNVAGVNPRISPYTGEALDIREGAFDRSGTIGVEGDGAYATLNYSFGNLTLTSVTSHLSGEFHNLVDGDGSIAPLFALDFFTATSERSQDLRLTSNYDGPFNFIVGLYYFKDVVEPTTTVHFGPPLVFIPSSTTSYTQTRRSHAVYADINYAFTEKTELYAGLRQTDEEGAAERFTIRLLSGPVTLPPTTVAYDETEPTGRIGVRHRFSDDVMGYAQYVKGYRSSAINGSAGCAQELNVANPEFLDSLEFGLKSQFRDRRVLLNTSLFYYDFTDQQFRNPAPGTTACAPNNPLATLLVNAAKARLYGLEVETIARVSDSLNLTVGVGLLESEYKELSLVDPDGIVRNLAGNKLLEAAPYTVNLALDYTFTLSKGDLVVHGDASWIGKEYFTAFNGAPPNDINVAAANWESSARVAYRGNDGKYEIGLWGKNLNDNDSRQWSVSPFPFGIQFTTVPYPQRFGVDFRWNF